MRLTLEQLKLLVESGAVQSARIRSPGAGWLIEARTAQGYVTLHTDRGAPRVFASLDTAARSLKSIGIAAWQADGTLWHPEQRSLV